MTGRDIAVIDCRASDGSLIARVEISPDMKPEARVELAPIIDVSEDEIERSGETRYQLRENGRYYYDLIPVNTSKDLRLRSTLSRRRPRIADGKPDSGRIETGSFCGTLLMEIVEGDCEDYSNGAIATAIVDVRSVKLDYRSEYRGMLLNLASRMADLIVDIRSSSKASFRSNFEEREDKGWFQVQLELLREVIENQDFAAALQRILAFPHELLETEPEIIPVERPFKWTPDAIRSLVHSPRRVVVPDGHPLCLMTGLKSVAAQLPAHRKVPTLDTPENRFVKHVLRDFLSFTTNSERIFGGAGPTWGGAAGLAQRLSMEIERWLSHPMFHGIGEIRMIPLGSPVLQRKAGYREILQWWLRFRTAADLSWDGGAELFHAGQRNVADLYEYWLFFGLLDWFCSRFNREGAKPIAEDLIEGWDGDSPCLKLKKRVPLGPFSGSFSKTHRHLHASFHYNREFKVTGERALEGSWSRSMHPDYTLSFWPEIAGKSPDESMKIAEEQELLVHIHLDAKYRVNSLYELFGTKGSGDVDSENPRSPGNYKRQDLLKMHAYRDAIKRSEGAYILYPGSDRCRNRQNDAKKAGADQWRHVMRGFHEIIPGLGAFAVAPDDSGNPKGIDGVGHLAGFLDDVIENLCNRASFRERRSAGLYEPLREWRTLRDAGENGEVGSSMLQDAPELDVDTLRLPAAPDLIVLVAWFDGPAEKKWMLEDRPTEKKVVLGLGERRGSLPLIKSLASATHILLHGPANENVDGLWKISPDPGQVLTRQELHDMGFPADMENDKDHIFAVFSVDEEPEFRHLKWDSDGLNEALVRFQNRQRPSYRKQLEKLTRDIDKPWLVSLADLQLAIRKTSGDSSSA